MKRISAILLSLSLMIPGIPLIGMAIGTSLIATTALVVDAPAANAGSTNCYNNAFGYSCSGSGGTTNCYNNAFGTSCSGPSGTTNCYDNAFGTSCSGSSGTTNCYNNAFGTSCSGSSGTTNCYNNAFGTSCSGSSGTTNCYNNAFGVSCSGTGSGSIPYIAPTPKPTPTYKTYSTYPTPTPTPTYKTYSTYPTPTPNVNSTQVCTTSLGLTESCKSYPSFYIEFCSASSSGTLQYKSETTWYTLWDITGIKNDRCNFSATPYYTVVSGDLKTTKDMSLKLFHPSVNGITPSADLFTVKINPGQIPAIQPSTSAQLSAMGSFTATLDKAFYTQGEIASLTIVRRDSSGNLVQGIQLADSAEKLVVDFSPQTFNSTPKYDDFSQLTQGKWSYALIITSRTGTYSGRVKVGDLPVQIIKYSVKK